MNKISNDLNRPPPVDAGCITADANSLQRDKVIRSFQAKHEVMLYIIEFMASLQLLLTKNPKRVMALTDLKTQAIQSHRRVAAEAQRFSPDKRGAVMQKSH